MIFTQDEIWEFCRNDPNKSNLNRLVIHWDFFNCIWFPIKWNFIGIFVHQVGNDNFLFGSFMMIIIHNFVELTRRWGFPLHDPVVFSEPFIKLMVSKGSVFKVHFIEDFYSRFILKQGRVSWTSSDHISSLYTDAGIWRSCILRFKVFL